MEQCGLDVKPRAQIRSIIQSKARELYEQTMRDHAQADASPEGKEARATNIHSLIIGDSNKNIVMAAVTFFVVM